MRSLSLYQLGIPQIEFCKNVVRLILLHVSYLPRTLTRGYFELPLAWHHSPKVPYMLVPKATHTAGTPPQVCGRSWESIIIPYVCYCGERATVRSNGCIYRSNCYNIHAHKGSHQLFGFLLWQGCYNGHHGAAHYIALLFSHISFVLKISYIQLSRNIGKDFTSLYIPWLFFIENGTWFRGNFLNIFLWYVNLFLYQCGQLFHLPLLLLQ